MDHSIEINDDKYFVRVEGSGPCLVLVHGYPLDHRMWNACFDPLAKHFTVVAPDLRGFGKSGGLLPITPMEKFADDIQAILEKLEIARPIHFCGLSMGGYIGWQFWKRHSGLLDKLILVDTRAAADDELHVRARRQNAEIVLSKGTVDIPNAMIPKLLSSATRENEPGIVAELEQIILSQDRRGVAAAQRGMAQREDAQDWLPEVNHPALVICGSEDTISPPSEMRAFAEKMPNAKFFEIPGSAHLPPMESAQPFCEQLTRFLQSS